MVQDELFKQILNTAAKAVEEEVKRLLIAPHRRKSGKVYPSRKGDLYNSIKSEVFNNVITILGKDYAEDVDKGIGPGKIVSIVVLEQWIRKNRIRPRQANGTFMSFLQFAYLIQRSIYRRGLNGRNFINPAITLGENIIMELIEINGIIIADQIIDESLLVLDIK